MPRTIPANRHVVYPADMILGRDIRAESYEVLVENHNFDYAHAGNRFGGIIFDPPFTTTSATYTTTDASGGRNLDTWCSASAVSRPVEVSGATKWRIEARVFGSDYDADFSVRNYTTGVDIGTINVVNTLSTNLWDSAYIELSTTDMTAGDVIGVSLDGVKKSTTEASIFQIILMEHVITDTTMLPTS